MVLGYKSKMNLIYNSIDLTEFSGGGPISGCMRNTKNELKNVVPGNRYQVQVAQLSIESGYKFEFAKMCIGFSQTFVLLVLQYITGTVPCKILQ